MSVFASSLIDRAVDQPQLSGGDPAPVPADLLLALRAVRDPRARRGRRHDVVVVLGVAVCAVLAGARSYVAIAEWARDLTPTVRCRLGLGRRPPSESTVRRVLQTVDAADLDRVVTTWLAARSSLSPGGRACSTASGDRAGRQERTGCPVRRRPRGAPAVGLRHRHRRHPRTDGGGRRKTNEISAFDPLLDRIDIAGALVTADALHTQRAHVHYLVGRSAHYLLTVKANQPSLLRQLTALPGPRCRSPTP